MMEKILVSQCLLGYKVNYRGEDALCEHPLFKQWREEGRLVFVCPEVSAGMSIPRIPSQIVGKGGGKAVLKKIAVVKDKEGCDVTDFYVRGAENALQIAQQHHIKLAILKERSPSCGSNQIYDGSFSGEKIAGEGVTAALLRSHDIRVFSNEQLEAAAEYLLQLESQNNAV